MNLSNKPSEKVSKSPLSGIRALVMTIALSVASCVGPQNTQPIDQAIQKSDMSECNIDDPVFIALVGISAEIQAAMECKDNRSLQFIWETVSKRLQEMNLKHDVSVSLCPPQQTERGFAYILIDITGGQQTQIFARDKKTAEQTTKDIQDFCITSINNRVKFLLGDSPATQEKLQIILQDEEKVLAKHRMIAIVQQDNSKSWTISFGAEM